MSALIFGSGLAYLYHSAPASFDDGLRYFAGPAVAGGWLSLLASRFIFEGTAKTGGTARRVALVGLNAGAALLLLALAFHLAIYLERRGSVSPLGYGTSLFYADLYLNYVREPTGRVLSVMLAVTVTWPAIVLPGWLVIRAIWPQERSPKE